jgi:hypothetical protein
MFHLDSSLCWFRIIRVLFCVLWVFVAENVDGLEEKVSGDTTTVDLQILLEVCLNISLRAACFSDETFFLVR